MSEKDFRERVMPLRRQMFGLALRLGIPPDDAADAVQETLIRLWKRRHELPGTDTELRLYALVSIRNECVSRLRQRRPTESIESAYTRTSETYDRVEQDDSCRRIECLLTRLPSGQREAIRLSAFAQLDNSEIAAATGQSEANVRQLLSRGRRRLKELMQLLNNQ